MKKNKTAALFLSLLLMFMIFTACSGDKSNKAVDKNSGNSSNWTYTGDSKFIFRGSTFIPKNSRDYTDEEKESRKDEVDSYSVEQDSMMKRVKDIEDKYGVTIVCEDNLDIWAEDVSEFAAEVSSGEYPTDIFHSELGFALDLYKAGYIASVKDLKAIDLNDSEKWGGPDKLMMTTYHGDIWGLPCIGSNYVPVAQISYGTIIYNYNTYASYNIDTTPKEMVESGKWTFDKFLELLPKVSNNSETETKWAFQYPPVESTGNIVYNAILANGGSKVIKNEDGKYVCGLSGQNTIKAMEWAQKIFALGKNTVKQDRSKSIDDFKNNKVTFLLTDGNRLFRTISESIPAEEYGWLPFPYGPDAEYGKTCANFITSHDSVMTIFNNEDNERVQASALLMNEMTDKVSIAGSEDYNDYLYRNYFAENDEFSFNVYLDSSKGMQYNYSLEYGPNDNKFVAACNELTKNTTDSPTTLLSKYIDIFNQSINDSMNK